MSIEKIRKTGIMILACVFGMVIIQLAAPIILGVLVQGMALVVPLAVYHFFVKEKWRLKLVRGVGEAYGERQEKYEAPYEKLDRRLRHPDRTWQRAAGQQPGMRKWERIRSWQLP